MKLLKRIVMVALVLVVAGAIAYFALNRTDDSPGTAPALAGVPTGASAVERGRYLTRAADCEACHTAPGGRRFAGGVAFAMPFGTIYSSNITADRATGIGSWSDDAFVRAVRQGVRADGARLYPAFPYTSYTQLSRDDVLAIRAYLASLPPVRSTPPPNRLSFPYDQRWAMGFWTAAFFDSRRFRADSGRSPAWNRGRYLATALGHCGECHTPRNFAFARKSGEALSGAVQQGWRAYNITADPKYGIGGWSDAELAQYLKSGHAPGRGTASGPMGEAVAYSLRYLAPADIDALVAYLRTVPARRGEHPLESGDAPASLEAASATLPAQASLQRPGPGLHLFAGACSGCHLWDGQGRERADAALRGLRSVHDPDGTNALQVILHGSHPPIGDGTASMPSFAGGYSDADIAALTNFVLGHFGGVEGRVTPKQVHDRRGSN